jgi:hypothetical protein
MMINGKSQVEIIKNIEEIYGVKSYKLTYWEGSGLSCRFSWHPSSLEDRGVIRDGEEVVGGERNQNNNRPQTKDERIIISEFEVLYKERRKGGDDGTTTTTTTADNKKDKVGVIRLRGNSMHEEDVEEVHDIREIPISEFEVDALVSQAQFITMANDMGYKTFVDAALPRLYDTVHLYTQYWTGTNFFDGY